MGLKSYLDKEMTTTVIFAVVGIAVGYVSFLINNPPLSFVMMLVIAGVFKLLVKKIMKITEDFKWWLGSGLVVYIFLWLVVWTIFYNVALR